MLYSKDFVASPCGYQSAFPDSIESASIEVSDENIFSIHLWDGTSAGVFVATKRLDYRFKVLGVSKK